jgi:hypothetical protein
MDGVDGPVAKGQGDERSESARRAETRQRGDLPGRSDEASAVADDASGIDRLAPATQDRAGPAPKGGHATRSGSKEAARRPERLGGRDR